ncbi:MAG: alpha/beta fold hydrolase [Betaproteobacteria bacterium]
MLILIPIVVAVAYLGFCVALFTMQRSFQYFPTPRRLAPTQLAGTFRNGDTLLQLTVRPLAGPGAVLYFGGNGEDVSGSVDPLLAAFPDREIVMLHYRGYGGSAGTPTEVALTADAAALFDKVHAEHPDVIVIGRSLGTGVAVRLASTRPVSRLVLVTPYDSLLGIAQRQFPAFPVSWLLTDKYESWRYVPKVTAPVLILAAELDEIIPTASSERLRQRFPAGQVTWVLVPRASHNTIQDHPSYVRALAAFDVAPAPAAVPATAHAASS